MLNRRKFYATFVSLILAIILLMTTAMTVQADLYPGVPAYPAHPGQLLPVVGNVPEWGYYGGYFAMWDRIMPSLESTIGFSPAGTGNYYPCADDWAYWDKIWDDPDWQYSTQNIRVGAPPPEGWDLTAFEWWLMPTGMLWNDAIILSQTVPPDGYNIWPYISSKSDNFYWKYQGASVASERKHWIDQWQLELMKNPVMANVYNPYIYEMMGSYVEGWYGTTWWYDFDNLGINASLVNSLNLAGYISDAQKTRLLTDKTLIWGITEDWWNYNPAFIATYTEETMANLISHTLYAMSLSPFPAKGDVADANDYINKPDLAAGPPVVSPDGLRVNITLRSGIVWSDNHPFDAGDVKYTLDLNLVPAAKAVALGDFAPIVKEVNILNPLKIELVLHRPYNDLGSILSNSWGLTILPEHYYSGIPISGLRGHISNYDAATHKGAPVLGAFKLDVSAVDRLEYVKNPTWFGTGLGYTVHTTVDKIILQKVEDASTRFSMLDTHDLDFAEYPTSPVQAFIDRIGRPDLTIFERPYVASNGVWFNFNNPYLSNRYVRLAIAYSIPYAAIGTAILPSWGVSNYVPGGCGLVHPWQNYGGIQLFNSTYPAYTFNPTLAQSYLDMWKLSRRAHAPDAAVGPVGDADFDGDVDLDDNLVWANNYGNTEAGHSFLPGNDEDADFDNSDLVDLTDYQLWSGLTGTTYPPVAHDY